MVSGEMLGFISFSLPSYRAAKENRMSKKGKIHELRPAAC